MKILILYNDMYGKRIVDFLEKSKYFHIDRLYFKANLPPIVEEPSEFLPEIPDTDLILFLIQNSSAIQILPETSIVSKAKAVIVAVDNPNWLPKGLQSQIEDSLINMNIPYVFARPFCTLDSIGDEYIDKFASLFGLPDLKIEMDNDDRIKRVIVNRSAPCGSTYFVAENLRHIKKEDAVEKAGLLLHNYPCMASMDYDKTVNDTLMHIAGYKIKNAVKMALKC